MSLRPSKAKPEKLSATRLANIPLLKDASPRALKAAEKEASHFSLPGGWRLFETGEPADAIYFVLSGSLGAFRRAPDGRTEFVGHIRSGEPVGEMALVAGETHQNAVYALRDTEVIRISRAGFMRIVKSDPSIMERLTRVMLVRLRQSKRRQLRASDPRVFALLSTSPTIDLSLRANTLAGALRRIGLDVVIIGEEAVDKDASYFDAMEANHDIVLLTAPIGDTPWFKLTLRQADRIWVLGRADAHPSSPLIPDDD
ncbi:MAG: cyclic nucleotide-binding domain-containing protein, partial [Pseudomonadota bacterium]